MVIAATVITSVNAQEGALSGGWVMDVRGAWDELAAANSVQEVLAEFDRAVDDPSMRCVPPGLIRSAESRAQIEIIEQDHQILILLKNALGMNLVIQLKKTMGELIFIQLNLVIIIQNLINL